MEKDFFSMYLVFEGLHGPLFYLYLNGTYISDVRYFGVIFDPNLNDRILPSNIRVFESHFRPPNPL